MGNNSVGVSNNAVVAVHHRVGLLTLWQIIAHGVFADGASRSGGGPLAQCLLELWATTTLPAKDIQRIAKAAIGSGANTPMIEALATIGHHGEYPNNARRDLISKLKLKITNDL